jgi:alpha-ketoglutaric semialdehyde dehydrogenase
MTITGETILGQTFTRSTGGDFFGLDAATGAQLPTAFGSATKVDLDRACALAAQAFNAYRAKPLAERAAFLERIGEEILALGDDLILRAMAESGLPRGRLEGERMRTVGQLRLFAGLVRDGHFLDLVVDPAEPNRQPLPKPDLKRRNVPVGPVAVFGASNFPLAFSVAGGDTASALAAGCPVVVKAHSAHPGTSELVGRAIAKAVSACAMPEGTFSLLFDSGYAIGQGLVEDPRIQAVGFTGSRAGGLALVKAAANRARPIPVYAEMSSINPVILLPGALNERGDAIGKAFVGSLTLGAGQFCTNPGLILALECEGLKAFLSSAADALAATAAQTMLTSGICAAYTRGVGKLEALGAVKQIAQGQKGTDHQGEAALFETTASAFLATPAMHEEVFGASGLIVRCANVAELEQVLGHLEGQLTASIHVADSDHATARRLIPHLEVLAGRLIVNGFGTSVEVSPAMVHGGPYPSTSDGRTTSVGTLAAQRFLRPVCYQAMPDALLPFTV